uniref:Dof zinc finger protein n=1 Tax=Nelumbo nucifera TaxID=4432 RepID=A0A822ZU02_NELNU|nr:TPA_asm: hypothetical protein HUJ06_018294 [Nelumbo nucifera]
MREERGERREEKEIVMFTQSEKVLPCPPRPLVMNGRWKPNVEVAPNCPRCDSSNTKFCYYNNYSLTQPRYFCKGCRRYWTKGGSLRNVPVGGGCRKNRRGKSVRISTERSLGGLDRSRLPPDDPSGRNLYRLDGANIIAPSAEATRSDASNIDLAVLYAKFLNQRPPDSDPPTMPAEFPRELDSSLEFPSISNPTHNPQLQFSHELGIIGSQCSMEHCSADTQLSEIQQVLLGDQFGMNSRQQERIPQFTSLDTNAYALQPLMPVEEVTAHHQDIFWSNSPVVDSNLTWPAAQFQGFESVHHDHHPTLHSNPIDGNWSSFDLPNYEPFLRP